ncbi:MAG: thioredoxin family protein [Candidatus Berkelbacteria bacterium]|nr:MAG: thioredoxin family protein [Candidatus Berkelbacteria bacterium]QQG51968.1 MAG: thioredoxin family protein [Candidatus Berkelbacteria bacterium]
MKILGQVIVVLLVVGGIVIYSNRSGDSGASPGPQTQSESSTADPSLGGSTDPSVAKTPGAYVDYSDSVIASTSGTKILFFHAPWCPQCRTLDADIRKSNVPAGVTIIKTDYDTNQALRQKYGVTIQTTLVRVDDAGNLVKKYVAYDEPTFAAVSSNLL